MRGAWVALPAYACADRQRRSEEAVGSEGGFPSLGCNSGLLLTNTGLRTAYADCFKDTAAEPCASVLEFRDGVAFATGIEASS